MKVIFVQSIAGVAERDQVKDVATGYALNYLIPKGLVVPATPQRLANLAARQSKQSEHGNMTMHALERLAAQLSGKLVNVQAKAATTGTLYAAVTPVMVAEAVRTQFKINLSPSQILPTDHLKTVGDHQIRLDLGHGKAVNMTVRVQAAT